LSNHIPSAIDVAQIATVDGCGCSKRKHDRSQWRHLIIDLASFVHIDGLESDLEAATSHAKGHSVHVDVIGKSCALLDGILVLWIVVKSGDSGIDEWIGGVLVTENRCVDGNL